ncbi:polysaccharide deacetylase family protein [Clostridium sp. YIM B02551]|uniref:polysaccharide deacetylase family protein n=1 Tax=Clostridium sp. YIM B02551 TaxID=2910679 RepID=UPI001EEC3AA2|nr:polysaccharide deacetylase family protein [Clostridium sp. YIM B02551]
MEGEKGKKNKINMRIVLIIANIIMFIAVVIVIVIGSKNFNNNINKSMSAISKTNIQQQSVAVTFIEDDATKNFSSKWQSILDQKKISISIAVISSSVNTHNYMSVDELKGLYSKGYDILSETKSYKHLDTLNTDEIQSEFQDSQSWLANNGFVTGNKVVVYPYGIKNTDTDIQNIAKQYYDYAININDSINSIPIKNKMNVSTLDVNTTDLDSLKKEVDKVSKDGGWLILSTHSSSDDFNKDTITNLIDYISSKNIKISKVSDVITQL